ncbi:MAG TPA: AzlD domain-containing protein [Acidimicrobiia bacterium]|jgi:branched-subunit amino acid transport protein|nr:AzlD domain-containing protein [Acidimicrobiia bacterium]
MRAFLAGVVVGIGTYVFRSLFIIALAKRRIPEAVLTALQFVAPAVLSALVVALLVDSDGNVAVGIPELAAFGAGGVVAYKTRSHVLTLFVGMGVFWLVRALV